MMGNPVLRIDGVRKTYAAAAGTVVALDGVTIQVAEGELAAVRGASGSGKSTLLCVAGGLLAPQSGRVSIGGNDVYRMGVRERAKYRAVNIGFVFQQFHLIPYLTALENILVPSIAVGDETAPERAADMLDRFNLIGRAGHYPSQLSTGERQRIALARALLNRPRLVLADEPTGNLDENNGETVLRHLRDFADQGGAVVLATHDPRATSLSDSMLCLEKGVVRNENTGN
jgi:putative ABC transport system ATP-binding protein